MESTRLRGPGPNDGKLGTRFPCLVSDGALPQPEGLISLSQCAHCGLVSGDEINFVLGAGAPGELRRVDMRVSTCSLIVAIGVSRLLCRAEETGRSDDNEAVIRHRLDLYHEQTEVVVAKYAERGILT
jgi:hypothetical protein